MRTSIDKLEQDRVAAALLRIFALFSCVLLATAGVAIAKAGGGKGSASKGGGGSGQARGQQVPVNQPPRRSSGGQAHRARRPTVKPRPSRPQPVVRQVSKPSGGAGLHRSRSRGRGHARGGGAKRKKTRGARCGGKRCGRSSRALSDPSSGAQPGGKRPRGAERTQPSPAAPQPAPEVLSGGPVGSEAPADAAPAAELAAEEDFEGSLGPQPISLPHLPFTGIELVWLALFGTALSGLGLALRLLSIRIDADPPLDERPQLGSPS
jgi:hypothetical protein